MKITDLPVEILIIIIQELDFMTVNSLYNTCTKIRNVIAMRGVVKTVNLSCNTMATANTFKLDCFKDISRHLLELNLRAVPDLSKTTVLPALLKLQCLRTLDISYTNLNLLDLMVIRKKCPSIKDIAINFTFGKSMNVPNKITLECQKVFAHFENVHLVGSVTNLLYSNLGPYILAKAKMDNLKYTIVEKNPLHHIVDQDFAEELKMPHFRQFIIYLMNWNYKKTAIYDLSWNFIPILNMLEVDMCEFITIVLIKDMKPIVYASPVFHNFLKESFDQNISNIHPSDLKLHGNVAIMMWNKSKTVFNEQFFKKLLKHIKQYFPYYFTMPQDDETSVPTKYDWFYTTPVTHAPQSNEVRQMSKQRLAAPNYELQYDSIFRKKNRLELTVLFVYPSVRAIGISEGCHYLKKLTYLSLVGFGRHTADFFKVLFCSCENLLTLNIENLPVSPCSISISRSLPLTKSLRNIRLVDKSIDFKLLFWAFSQCPTLENFHIIDERVSENNELAYPDYLLAKCKNLYSVYIEAQMTDATKAKIIQRFKIAKKTCLRPYLNVVIQHLTESNQYCYDPFVDVYKLNPIKPF